MLFDRPIFLLLFLSHIQTVVSLGCIETICEDNAQNSIANADCSIYRDHCGSYEGKRFDNSLFKGLDIRCLPGKKVFAPFDGKLSTFRPRGGQKSHDCVDQGIEVIGHGNWSGFVAKIGYVRPLKFNGHIKKGDEIGWALDLTCASAMGPSQTRHVTFQLMFRGRPIDPTYRLSECYCTGRICWSNSINEIIGQPFKYMPKYGKGYELRCENTQNSQEEPEMLPKIYSPIQAKFLGRFRPWPPKSDGTFACENDGIFLEGDGQWKKFVVHIYNVKFILEPTQRQINQGELVAERLNCSNTGAMAKSIFLEFRFEGKLVNVTQLITASDCKLPSLSV